MINKYLLALACGDSYGSYFENDGLQGQTFNIKELPNTPKSITLTDDTKMAKILLLHYFKYKTIIEDELFYEYKNWAKTSGVNDGIGIHTFNVLINNVKNKDSQGNGALMRNIPFALQLINDGYSFEKTLEFMNIDSFLTHENDVISLSNEISLDLALNGLSILKKSKYKTFISKLHLGSSAWVIHSLYIVIGALKQELNFLDGYKFITSFGGDTDTNCAIFSAIRSYKYDIRNELDIEKFVNINDLEF